MAITIRGLENASIFDIEGDMKRPAVGDVVTLHQFVKKQLEDGKRNLLLNFEKVDFIDSFGVGELLSSFVSTQNVGGKLKLVKISKKVRFLFEVTGIIKLFEVFDDEEEATKSFSK